MVVINAGNQPNPLEEHVEPFFSATTENTFRMLVSRSARVLGGYVAGVTKSTPTGV